MTSLENYIIEHTEKEDVLLTEINRQTHLTQIHPRMLSGHLQGKFLEMISLMIRPKKILEIGTFTGYSAICLSKGLQENGKLHTIEINDELEEFILKYIKKAKLENSIHLHIGDANDILPDLKEEFDLVFIDGEKREYLNYYHLVFQKVKKGGFILVDNVLWNGKVIENVNEKDKATQEIIKFNDFVHHDKKVQNMLLPIRDGLMLLRKIV